MTTVLCGLRSRNRGNLEANQGSCRAWGPSLLTMASGRLGVSSGTEPESLEALLYKEISGQGLCMKVRKLSLSYGVGEPGLKWKSRE